MASKKRRKKQRQASRNVKRASNQSAKKTSKKGSRTARKGERRREAQAPEQRFDAEAELQAMGFALASIEALGSFHVARRAGTFNDQDPEMVALLAAMTPRRLGGDAVGEEAERRWAELMAGDDVFDSIGDAIDAALEEQIVIHGIEPAHAMA